MAVEVTCVACIGETRTRRAEGGLNDLPRWEGERSNGCSAGVGRIMAFRGTHGPWLRPEKIPFLLCWILFSDKIVLPHDDDGVHRSLIAIIKINLRSRRIEIDFGINREDEEKIECEVKTH
jgi:hypothetical protein